MKPDSWPMDRASCITTQDPYSIFSSQCCTDYDSWPLFGEPSHVRTDPIRPSARSRQRAPVRAFAPPAPAGLARRGLAGSAKFLGEPDEMPLRPTDVAEPIHVLILDHFAYELRAARAEPFKRLVDVVHGEHDAEVAQGVDRGVPV